ncbi:hypothetical protein H5410_021742 [Solanum commersonii]|uniref:Uncharacterized protein n=1 Tax=Solanum commersonii TaxID=4109 RepID=A0A9J5ZDE2_SOLCO|nr:hypothetical protein H5410_021742 [Solanum commersonii]
MFINNLYNILTCLCTPGYWEWGRRRAALPQEILELIKVYDVVYTSLFTYDYGDNRCPYHFGTYKQLEVSTQGALLWLERIRDIDTQRELLLSKSCRYLFSAFYRLAKDDLHEVSVHDWVKFWFRGPNRYVEPSQKVSKVRATKPRLNHNPYGHIDSNFLPQTDKENVPFVELDVEE